MMPRTWTLRLLALTLASLGGCAIIPGYGDYDVAVRGTDLANRVDSLYVIVGPEAELAAASPTETGGLVHPDKQRKYSVFAQFKPSSGGTPGWEQGANVRTDEEVEIDASKDGSVGVIEITVGKKFLDIHPDAALAIAIMFTNREWVLEVVKATELHAGGKRAFSIDASTLRRTK